MTVVIPLPDELLADCVEHLNGLGEITTTEKLIALVHAKAQLISAIASLRGAAALEEIAKHLGTTLVDPLDDDPYAAAERDMSTPRRQQPRRRKAGVTEITERIKPQ